MNDDELKLPDFKKWFSFLRKYPERQSNQPSADTAEPSQNDEEEVTLDWSNVKGKVTSWFKSAPEKEDKSDESIDWHRVKRFARQHATLLILLALVIIQFVPNDGVWPWGGMQMRLLPTDMPVTSDWARDTVHNSLRGQIGKQIDQQYPNLPDTNKKQLIEEQLQVLLKSQKDAVDAQISQLAAQFKSRFEYEESGKSWRYMPDIDPYVYVRYARNYLKHGYIGDERLPNGQQIDTHQFAPLGNEITGKTLHPYVLASIHKIASVLSPGIPLLESTAYFPIIFALLSMFPAFFIARRYGGNLAGIIAASMVVLHPAFTGRTIVGHADTDAYNVFFPLIIAWIFLESFYAKKTIWKTGLSALTGIAIGIYSFAWSGWWYIFDFLLAVSVGYLLWLSFEHRKRLSHLLKRDEMKSALLIIGMLLVFAGIFVSAFSSFESFYSAPLSPLRFRIFKAAAHPTLWPNVYTTVAELNPLSVKGVINQFGTLLMLIALAGALGSMLLKSQTGRRDMRYGLLLIIWFGATIYASTKGMRFTMLLVPAFALGFGTFWGLIDRYVGPWAQKQLSIPKILTTVLIIGIVGFMFIQPVRASYSAGYHDTPIVNDAWWNSLRAIHDGSNDTAIITSWWDFGHHFKYIADRPVTFDGGSQNTPLAHWVGKLLLTDDEDLSVGILRMLNCGSNMAFNKTMEVINNTPRSVSLLYQVVKDDRAAARQRLIAKGFDEAQAEAVLQYTHCNPPESFLITSADMVGKSGVWGHFGSWDFIRADLWQNVRHMSLEEGTAYLQREYNMSAEKAESLYFEARAIVDEGEANTWIAPWPSFASGPSKCSLTSANAIECDNGLILENNSALIRTAQGQGIPQGIAYISKQGKFKTLTFNGTSNIEAALYPAKDGYESFFAAEPVARSMFARLFYMQGHDLRYYKLFSTRRQITGSMIYVWKVDWNGTVPNIMDAVRVPANVSDGVIVDLDYIGWLDNGSVFDSNIIGWRQHNITRHTRLPDTGTRPLTFTVGAGQVIVGFENALRNATVNETRVIHIAPEEAYGTDPAAHPLGNKTLNFKVRIRDLRAS